MRSVYWQQVRGIAIIGAVVTNAVGASTDIGETSMVGLADTFLAQAFAYAVPLFLGVYGHLMAAEDISSPRRFYARILPRILGPYLFWSALYIAADHRGQFLDPAQLARSLLTGSGMIIGYYILVLSQMILLTPLIARLPSGRWHAAVLVAMTLAGLIYTYGLDLAMAGNPLARFPLNSLPFFVWYPFFHLGYCLRRFPITVTTLPRPPVLFALWLGTLVLATLEARLMATGAADAFLRAQYRGTTLLAAGMLFLALLSCHEHRSWRFYSPGLHALGNIAFFIYFAHLMSFGPIEAAMEAMPWLASRWLYVLVLSIASIAACAVIALVARRLPRKIQALLLGL